jgi:hypothetical protein
MGDGTYSLTLLLSYSLTLSLSLSLSLSLYSLLSTTLLYYLCKVWVGGVMGKSTGRKYMNL